MSRTQVLGGLVFPLAMLIGTVAWALSGGEKPGDRVALMVVAPALGAIVAPTAATAIVAGATVVSAVVVSAMTFGQQFNAALPALVWVIAVSGAAVMLASVRPKIVVGAPVPRSAPSSAGVDAVAPELQDPITGLPTRAALLAMRDAPLEGAPRLVAVLDLDDLAGINDRHGRAIGDTLLFAVAGRTRYALDERPDPQDEIVARWGDDEFVVVISAADDAAQALLTLIVDKVNENLIRTDSGLIEATMSAGAVMWQAGESLGEAVLRARGALHRAKARGQAEVEVDLSSDR